MTDRYEVEALLRPPVELYSAVIAGAAAAALLAAPHLMLMPPAVAWPAAAGLLVLVVRPRLRDGLAVIAYQASLKRLPTWRLKPRRIPVSKRRLFLGRGFVWRQVHTQRLRDTLRPEARRFIEPGPLYHAARTLERCLEGVPVLSRVGRLTAADRWWNPLRPRPPVGGNPVMHAIEPDEETVTLDLADRVGHILVLGTTRVGKTRLAEVLVAQDIRRGDVVIVFDPKGDAGLLRRVYAEARRAGRDGDFYAFHLGFPARSARYNAIGSFSRITAVATRIANQLPAAGNAAAFKEFAWRFTNVIASALVALGRRPDYRQIRRYINDIDPLFQEYARTWLARHGEPDWPRALAAQAQALDPRSLAPAFRGRSLEAVALHMLLRERDVRDPVLQGLATAFRYDRTWYDKVIASLGPLLEKLTTGKTAELLAPDYLATDDPRPIFAWRDVIRRRAIVYVGLDAMADTAVSSAVGNAMFADLVGVAADLYKHGPLDGLPDLVGAGDGAGEPGAAADIPISIHADEFSELIGEEFLPLLNKAGGAGMQITAYSQTWSDIEAGIGNRAKAGVITGNFNTLIMLRVRDLVTARLLTDQLPQVELQKLITVSGVNDSSDPTSGVHFVSTNQDRIVTEKVPMITPAEVMALPKGHAFALLHGGTLHKLRLPLPDDRGEAGLPRDLEAIALDLEQRYATAEGWHRHHEPWWGVGGASGAVGVVGAVADTADLGPAAPVAGLSPAVAEAVADDPPDAEAVGLADVSLADVSLTEAGVED